MYISSYIHVQKLLPRFLWVSKFDVKLGSFDLIFKILVGSVVFNFHTESKVFQTPTTKGLFCQNFMSS